MDLVNEHHIGSHRYVWMASTLGGNPISASAANAALTVLRQLGTYERLHALGKWFRDELRSVLERRQITAQVIGDGPLAQIVFTERKVNDYRSTARGDKGKARSMMFGLLDRSVFINPMGTKFYLSIVHDEAICGAFCERLDETLQGIQ
jgi:glutamate-1-semialdehyde 2,1-aminomutase